MKKYIAILLCVCSLCALSMTALADDDIFEYTIDQWKVIYSVPEPQSEDYEDSDIYTAAWNAWFDGLCDFIVQETQAEYARQAQEEADRLAAEEEARKAAEEKEPPAPVESTPTESIESAGANNGSGIPYAEPSPDDVDIPVGSYFADDGSVWTPDGTQLHQNREPGTTPASAPAEDDVLSSDMLDNQSDLSVTADPDTPAVTSDTPAWYVEDLRTEDVPETVSDGLKALVTSIFGEYTPVTTTAVVTETVENETYQYLVETVAPGAAGVDYEWVAGVVLFGIMLFCLMKLLGGVLK